MIFDRYGERIVKVLPMILFLKNIFFYLIGLFGLFIISGCIWDIGQYLINLLYYNNIKKKKRFSLTGKDFIKFFYLFKKVYFKIKYINLIKEKELLSVSKENEILLSELSILIESHIKNKNIKINVKNLKSYHLKEYCEKNIKNKPSLLKNINSEVLDEINLLLDNLRKKL